MQKPRISHKNSDVVDNYDYCFHFSFNAEVDITGSEITSVDDSSFIVRNGEVSILESEHDSDSESDQSADNSVASL